MQKGRLIFIFLATLFSCAQTKEKKGNYPLQVGDIYFDQRVDDPHFKLCDEDQVLQYYNFGKGLLYKGEKIKINNHFRNAFKVIEQLDESGYLTIRFIVNWRVENENTVLETFISLLKNRPY